MIDWHSHVLPAMDDGSRDAAESVSMLEMLASQGVDTVIATPHFYANDESVESFLNRRDEAYAMLKSHLTDDLPAIILGAEVKFYSGISRSPDLKALRIQGSQLLLLEMPFAKWTEYMVRELIELSCKSGIQIVLAHVERYLGLQKKSVWERIAQSGILMQVNGSFFTSFSTKRKAISLLREGSVQFVGSDCHNTTSRAPKIGDAFEIIQKKLGDDFIAQMNEYGTAMLETVNKTYTLKG